MRVDVQLIEPCHPYPLCGHADELEDEGFDAAGFLQSEGFRVRIEFIALACVGCIGRIARGQF